MRDGNVSLLVKVLDDLDPATPSEPPNSDTSDGVTVVERRRPASRVTCTSCDLATVRRAAASRLAASVSGGAVVTFNGLRAERLATDSPERVLGINEPVAVSSELRFCCGVVNTPNSDAASGTWTGSVCAAGCMSLCCARVGVSVLIEVSLA